MEKQLGLSAKWVDTKTLWIIFPDWEQPPLPPPTHTLEHTHMQVSELSMSLALYSSGEKRFKRKWL